MSLPSEFRADLHCHSTCSDGTLHPKEIVMLAKSQQLSGLSITDHDSIFAYPEVIEEAKKHNIAMIPGIEFSAMHKGKSVHILGYSFNLAHGSISTLCERHKARRKERNQLILEKLAKKGILVEENELKSLHVIGRPHIAQALVEKGFAISINDAFNKYLGDNKSCYVQGNPINVEETLDAIHQAKGLAVIAHPHLEKNSSFINELLEMAFDGLECYYARFPANDHEKWRKLALKKNLLITGGSDFHGSVKPSIPLGCSWVNKETFEYLWQHYLQKSVTYSQAIQKLFNINNLGLKLGLSNVQRLLEAFQHPEKSFKTIHVAGTNGKGSVTTKIAKGLECIYNKVGLFTSPHINCFRERIQINGQLISEEDTFRLLQKIFHMQESLGVRATFFEITTVLCFLYFAESGVEYAAIETGLGGRLDATNVLLPELSIITSISLDHTEILGNSLELITREKAGIIKKNVPILIGPKVMREIIEPIARNASAPIHQVSQNFSSYHEENNSIAKQAMQLLNLPNFAIQKGVEAAPPCRFEIIQKEPPIICDVAHNPDGLKAMFKTVAMQFPNRSIQVVLGLSKSKDIQGCARLLAMQPIEHFFLVKSKSDRGASPEELQKKLLNAGVLGESLSIFSSVAEGVREAKAKQKKNLLLITGTFFMMGEARRELGFHDICDFLDLNEPAPV